MPPATDHIPDSSPPRPAPPGGVGRAVLFALFILGLVIAGALGAFFLAVRGEERTLVPQVAAEDLLVALGKLQEKGLVPRVEARFSADHAKWTVIDQEPIAGTLVKAGRPVVLIVSRGPIVDQVANYVGRDLDEVVLELQTLFASSRALITIRQPVSRVTDAAPAGTILDQSPAPETPLDGPVELELVVSKGPRGDLLVLEDYVAQPFAEVRARLAEINLPFVFRVTEAGAGEAPGIVVSQSPRAGEEIPYSSILQLEMTAPAALEEGQVFGLLELSLPEYPILVDLRLEVITPAGNRTILQIKHPGGPLAIPYVAAEDGQLVLFRFGDDILTEPVRPYR